MKRTALMIGLAVLIASASPALAHKVIASGYAAGEAIEGEVGFSNGDVVAQTTVSITDPDGQSLGQVQTDADGFFRFVPTKAVPHIFRSDLGSGHVAEFRMEVSELPRALQAQAATAQDRGATAAESTAPAPAALGAVDTTALQEMVAQAVRDEVRPLRRELIASREQASLQSVLGGLGTILGLVGVVFYMMARRKLADAAAGRP
jgi:nickel transport protein